MRLSIVEMGNFGEKEGQSFETPHPQGKATWGSGVTPGDQELVPGVLEGHYGSTSAGSGELEELAPALAEVEPLEEEKAPEHVLPEGEARPELEEVQGADDQHDSSPQSSALAISGLAVEISL